MRYTKTIETTIFDTDRIKEGAFLEYIKRSITYRGIIKAISSEVIRLETSYGDNQILNINDITNRKIVILDISKNVNLSDTQIGLIRDTLEDSKEMYQEYISQITGNEEIRKANSELVNMEIEYNSIIKELVR